MSIRSKAAVRCICFVILVCVSWEPAAAATIVRALGDAGWDSGDTRAAGYFNNNNPPDNQLVRGRPRADNPVLLEDTLINERIGFALAPVAGPTGPGALRLTTDQNPDKATLDKQTPPAPFAGSAIRFEYDWFRPGSGAPTVAAPALKLTVDTSEPNPTGDQATDRGETIGDKILVYEPYRQAPTVDDTWTTETIVPSQGRWWMVNLYTSSTLPATNENDLRTLDEWISTFDASGLAADASIVSLQLGIGSGNAGLVSYVDYLEVTLEGETTRWDFGIPEPSSGLIVLLGAILLVGQSRK